MNRRLAPPPEGGQFTFDFDGESIPAVPGDTIASALLAAGHDVFSRSIKYHRPRGPFCLAGRCSHCLVRADGRPDIFACVAPVRNGMEVSTQNAYPTAKHDLLGAIDWFFPKGMDHHEMFAGVPVAEDVMAVVARHVAGLGPLPDKAALIEGQVQRRRVEAAVVGAGPAGLACARAAAEAGLQVELFDEAPTPGGRLRSGLGDGDALRWAEETVRACADLGVTLSSSAVVLATYCEEGRPLLAVRCASPDRLELVEAGLVVYCTGSSQPLVPFKNNDLPGIFAGRGLAELVTRQRVLPGSRAVLVGSDDEVLPLARLIRSAAGEIVSIVDPAGALSVDAFPHLKGYAPVEAKGGAGVRSLVVASSSGDTRVLHCDLVALCGPRSPAFELPLQAGASTRFDPATAAYVVSVDPRGSLGRPGLYAAGDAVGLMTVASARASGEAVGAALGKRTP